MLASTSVGQEGLDFHVWSHAVVHWNLPSNPVDLEQREGRVHRYKCHAVRRSVARRYGDDVRGRPDVWNALFDAARAAGTEGDSELIPYWILRDPEINIERHVPALLASREVTALPDLLRRLARYRLVFGQPRQDDLLALIEQLPVIGDAALVDLRPPTKEP